MSMLAIFLTLVPIGAHVDVQAGAAISSKPDAGLVDSIATTRASARVLGPAIVRIQGGRVAITSDQTAMPPQINRPHAAKGANQTIWIEFS